MNDTVSDNFTAMSQNALNNGLTGGSIVFAGSSNPTSYGLLMNEFSYKGIDLSVNITYKFGYYLFKPALNYYELATYGTYGLDYNKRQQQPGDNTRLMSLLSFIYPLNQNRNAFYSALEINVIRGDHIRLQFINLSYSFMHSKANLPFKSLQVYINATNPGILWRPNHDHVDPDYMNSIPDPKIYILGIRANF